MSSTATAISPTASTGCSDQPRRLLIAEDEHILAKSLETDLQTIGYDVVGLASNGQRAIELAQDAKPDLALMDLRMPQVDGLEAGQAIYDRLNIPIVMVSAYSDKQYVESATAIGVFGYVLKPVSIDTLRVTISVAWNCFTEQQGLAREVAAMEQKLEARKLVERAKGLIMTTLGLSESDAMRRLQKQARDSRRPMSELARSLIEAHDLLKKDNPPAPLDA